MYEIFEHTADLGLRVRAASLEELFVDAARGLFSMIVANPEEVAPAEERTFHLEGDEVDLLLFDWLNELLYTFESQRLLLIDFDVHIEERAEGALVLSATCRGAAMDDDRHRMEHEVKAITYHGLSAEQQDGAWMAEIIVDI